VKEQAQADQLVLRSLRLAHVEDLAHAHQDDRAAALDQLFVPNHQHSSDPMFPRRQAQMAPKLND
jgi:hypothetical protein